MFKVQFTASKFTEESMDHGDHDSIGYINPDWSYFEFLEQDDEFSVLCDTKDGAEDKIEEYLGSTEQERSHYYADDVRMDNEGNTWTYCGHIDEV